MNIWHSSALTIEQLNQSLNNTLSATLDMEFTELGENYLCMKMPVCSKTHQPMGLLHGGASAALAETIGSVGSWCIIDTSAYYCVGVELNCTHLKSIKEGFVYAQATPLHIGKKTHVWDIKITNQEKTLICTSRLTVYILPKNND